jgi:hypothetical protein
VVLVAPLAVVQIVRLVVVQVVRLAVAQVVHLVVVLPVAERVLEPRIVAQGAQSKYRTWVLLPRHFFFGRDLQSS